MRYVQVCKALYDYESRTEDELSVKENDILYIIEKEDDDWWRAELKQQNGEDQGPVGLVPADYLEEVTPIGRVRAEFDYAAQQEEELSFEEGDEMDLLEQDDPDWFLVKSSKGEIGLAPSNYVQDADDHFEEAQEQQQVQQQDPIPTPPVVTQASMAPPAVQPILSHTTGSTTATREVIVDDAQSWNVHEYDAAKKKKKKGKGSLFVGNGMICYGSETDKSLPVQQYPILDVTKYLYDGKNLHIEIDGAKQAVLDLQASSKSEAKAILVKISDSTRAAQMSNTHLSLSSQKQIAAPAPAIPPMTSSSSYEIASPSPQPHHDQHEQDQEEEEEESNCVPKWGISIYSFQAEGGDELSVEENEQIYVLDYERTDGWWRVQKVDGDVGLVPSSYVQFDDEEGNEQEHDHSTAAAAGLGAAAAAAAAASSRNDNVEEIRRKRAEEERALQQQRVAEERARQVQQRKEQEEQDRKRREQEEEARRRREEEEARRRREEERQREEEERERRRQVQEAAKRAEAARQKQLEEDYKRKEAERKASLARSASKTRHQDLPKPDPTKIRTWTDRSGSFKVEAQFIDFHNGKLRLHKLNGVKIDVPVEKMCAEDVRWVEKHTRRPSQDDAEMTPAMPPRPPQQQPPAAAQPVAQPPQKKLNERWDWFDWFMIVGIPMQQSLQYAASFKAEKLDDSDIPNLTHKQMKILGLKEEHVQRVERYIETGQPEETTEEVANKKKELSQIEKDEELARQLQKEWESSEGGKGKAPSSNARPRPNVSAPKDVHPDLLDFIGSQLGSSSTTDNGKGKEPEKPKGDLIGFNDDAWAPRAESSPIAAMSSMKTAQSSSSVVSPPVPAGPTPEQMKAAEAERKRIQEEEQIQKIQLMNLQRQAKEQQQQLEQLQKLTQQQLELQKQLAMQTGTQQQQQQQQQQMLQVQAQQQQLQQQLAQQPPQLQPSFAAQPTGFNAAQPTGGFNAAQPTGFNASQPTGFSPQSTAGFQTGFSGLQQPTPAAGRQRPTPSHSLPLDPSLGQWQSNQPTGFQQQQQQQQPMQTGFQQQPQQQPIQQNSWQALQPQMTGFPASSQPVGGSNYQQSLPPPLAPSSTAAGQQGLLSRSHTIGAQPTGRHWNSATPDNPFGSPTLSPLQAQMTGVQFSTPSPQAFHQSPLQSQQPTGYMQPQMTGFPPQQPPQQPAGNSIFTPQGSMQYGQSAFPNNQRPW
ncbi:cell wall organization and biogenesis-related protein [Mucor ambiguus]|uniref:Actin cytoskeleton-regulatory complex protein SLA1 n=1 Tax=Mucor ambiguus TaxID=91626 RepID=A0A0C9MT04_9FUNG|nr:cell wall organization and biogenesis-related protein [Mucor ambiguus]